MAMKLGLLGEEQMAALADVFKECPYIIAAYQFGSTTRGKGGPLSDLDIALLLNEAAPTGVAQARVEGLLAHRIQQCLAHEIETSGAENVPAPEIDVISLNGRSIIFQHTVLRTGRVIYDTDPKARQHYEWKIVQAYLDFEPTLRWMRRFQREGWLRRCGLT